MDSGNATSVFETLQPTPTAVPPAPTFSAARLLWRLPRLAFLLFAIAVVALLWFLDASEREEQRLRLISDVLWLEQNLHFMLAHNEELLAALDPARLDDAGNFEAHARSLLGNRSGLLQIFWIHADRRIRQAYPPLPDSPPANASGTNLPLPSSSYNELARSLGQRVYGPLHEIGAGNWHISVHVPIFRRGQLQGTVVGVYRLRQLIEDAAPWWLTERYRLAIADTAGRPLAERSKVAASVVGEMYQLLLDPPGQGLLLQAAPYPQPSPLAYRTIAASLVLLALLMLASLWALKRHMQGRIAAETALQTEVAFRKAMEDSLQTGLRARDPAGKIIYVNPAFCAMVGWPPEQLLERSAPMPYWPEEYLDEAHHMFDKVMAGKAPPQGFEMKFKRRNGELFDALIHEAPLIDRNGRQIGWMGSVVDISEQKRIAEQARLQEERLQASARLIAMGEMASSLAHELNQPLTAISSYATGCRNLIGAGSTDCQAIDQALLKCQEQAQRAARILRRIYDFARRHEPDKEWCDPAALLADTLAMIETEARRNRILLRLQVADTLPPIEADRVLLVQSLLNLFKNALDSMRHTPVAQRQLSISACHKENQLLIDIADRGCGIPAEATEQMFEPFFTTKSEGLGVGLNICRSVVEAHRGRLWFDANPEGGTIFHISLPLPVCAAPLCPA